MLKQYKIQKIKRTASVRENRKPLVAKKESKRKRAVRMLKRVIKEKTSDIRTSFLFSSFGEFESSDSKSDKSAVSSGYNSSRLPSDTLPNEIGNVVFGKRVRRRSSGWGNGAYDARSNTEGMMDINMGFNIGNFGSTPSSDTGPKTGGSFLNLGKGRQSPYSGYIYTESSSRGSDSRSGVLHGIRTPKITLDFNKYKDIVFEFDTIAYQSNRNRYDWELKVQYCQDKNFNTRNKPIYDVEVTWGYGDSNSTNTINFNARAYSDGGDNKLFDTNTSSWAGSWKTCRVKLPATDGQGYDSRGTAQAIDFSEPFYLRITSKCYYHTQDLSIDSVSIYGYTK